MNQPKENSERQDPTAPGGALHKPWQEAGEIYLKSAKSLGLDRNQLRVIKKAIEGGDAHRHGSRVERQSRTRTIFSNIFRNIKN